MSLETLYTPEEVMDVMRISESTFYRLCQCGLPHVRVDRAIRISATTLDKWVRGELNDVLREGTVAATRRGKAS